MITVKEPNVLNLIIPMLALLLSFLSALASLRYFLTRMGRIYWIIPFVISVILFYQNIKTLLEYAASSDPFPITFDSVLPLVLTILWYAMVQAFHFALKTEREYNKYVEESRSTYNEARFINLMEKRQMKKEQKERHIRAENEARKTYVPQYNFPPEEE